MQDLRGLSALPLVRVELSSLAQVFNLDIEKSEESPELGSRGFPALKAERVSKASETQN